jgi:hypothetical protein
MENMEAKEEKEFVLTGEEGKSLAAVVQFATDQVVYRTEILGKTSFGVGRHIDRLETALERWSPEFEVKTELAISLDAGYDAFEFTLKSSERPWKRWLEVKEKRRDDEDLVMIFPLNISPHVENHAAGQPAHLEVDLFREEARCEVRHSEPRWSTPSL